MKQTTLKTSLAAILALGFGIGVSMASERLSPEWKLAGSNPDQYDANISREDLGAERYTGFMASNAIGWPQGFATLIRTIDATPYRGKRLRLVGDVEPHELAGRGQIWMRIDSEGGQVLKMDNMHTRPIRGTSASRSVEIVLEVPQEGASIAYGILIAGRGALHFDGLRLEAVDASVALTAK